MSEVVELGDTEVKKPVIEVVELKDTEVEIPQLDCSLRHAEGAIEVRKGKPRRMHVRHLRIGK